MHDGIYRRKDSPFWWASWSENGKTVRRSTGIRITNDPRGTEAKRVRAGLLAGGYQPAAEPGYRWIDIVGQYIADNRARWRPATQMEYRHALKKLVAFFGEDSGLQTRSDVKVYIREQLKTLAPGSVNIHITLMRAAYSHARVEMELDIPNPWERRTLPVNNERGRYLTREEADRLIAAAETSKARYLSDFIRLALNTGLRHRELLGLTWDRIDLEAGTIAFEGEDQKNGKRAVIPINSGARIALMNRLAKRDGDRVFACKGRPIISVKNAFMMARTRAGLPDVCIHDLRRTFGSWLVQSGVSIHAVSGLLRHSDIRITARVYAHLGIEEYREAASVLDAAPKLRVIK